MAFMRWLRRKAAGLFFTPVREITVSRSVLEDLAVMAQGAHPKEMIALLSASRGNREGRVHIDELQLQAYYASEDSASVMLSNLPMTTTIVGTAHSHPGGSKRPSEADLHLFSKFGYVHAIIGEPYRQEDAQFYDKNGRRMTLRII